MQTEESPKFRLNLQVVGMLAVVFAALTIPVAGVVISAQKAIKGSAQPASTPSSDVQPMAGLQGSLEGMADQALLPVETVLAFSVSSGDVAAEAARVRNLGEVLGGEAVIMRELTTETVLMVKIPSDQAAVFLQAFKKTELKPATEGETFFEVKIHQP